MSTDIMIEAKGLTKTYGDFKAIQNVSFDVRKGEVLGFLGPNGAGKTTTMKILTCFIAPTEGTAKVNGCDVSGDPLGVRKALGYLPESNPLYTEMLVFEFLQWAAHMRGLDGQNVHNSMKRAVEQTDLGDVLNKEIFTLSKGYKQRVGLAQAILHEPPIMILDEPMSGLDPNQAVEIRSLIKELGKERTIILSTHNLAEAEASCDRLLVITKGEIVADDTPKRLRESAGKTRYCLALKGNDAQAARRALEGTPGVQTVSQLESDGELRFDVIPSGADDLREPLFRAAVDGGLTLLELRVEESDLEGKFRELTLGSQTGTASTPAKRDAA